ncbi:MAG: winged helix-turn-helix transcriptional regulator [Candidatus Tectomicrobia bacterium]|uniref:Winged helix-turn-helix transcriptional regulator n=1 Tax=Tectimicrobiota bacterium TaxID=2528274 RepID=A0A937VY94_UNCTE|nr:winged helix-turn-helix transcriptional regulator [Candidatus Tectomicrobia bacterium]
MQAFLPLTRALADKTRLRILESLCNGAATVNDLAAQLDLPQPRISSHLALLRRSGLVSMHAQGRQHTYQVDARRVGALCETLQAFLAPAAAAPPRSSQAAREVRHNSALRQGRSCYDHLAGVVGVQLLDALLRRGWLDVQQAGTRQQYRLTPTGEQELQARGVALAQAYTARRQFAYGCLDWTERRVHVGGALGAVLLEALLHAGVVTRQPGIRTLQVHVPLSSWLDRPAATFQDRSNTSQP